VLLSTEAHIACGSMVRADQMCAVSALGAENRTPIEIKYRSAEGKKPTV
jgi:hypothetical protein